MASHTSSFNKKILILLAPGFEEKTTIILLDHLREAGLPVSLVSLTAGLVAGLHGLAVRPDCSLEQLADKSSHPLIIVPGGRQCVSTLVTDPRVHQLLEITLKNDGFVAVTSTAESILAQIDIPATSNGSHVLLQKRLDIEKFANELINRISDV